MWFRWQYDNHEILTYHKFHHFSTDKKMRWMLVRHSNPSEVQCAIVWEFAPSPS
jgi:hypothetical protein